LVFVQDHVSETKDLVAATGNYRELTLLGLGQSMTPHRLAIGYDVPVKIGIKVGTSVVASPAVGMQSGDGVDISIGCVEIPHSNDVLRHVAPHRSWRWHRALAGCRTVKGPGPSGHSE
jgi:hypothetical protein